MIEAHAATYWNHQVQSNSDEQVQRTRKHQKSLSSRPDFRFRKSCGCVSRLPTGLDRARRSFPSQVLYTYIHRF